MNETLEIISSRRSIKGYTDTPVSREILDKIIKAGTEAASGRNLQGAIIVAVTRGDVRDRLSAANAERQTLGGQRRHTGGQLRSLLRCAHSAGRAG